MRVALCPAGSCACLMLALSLVLTAYSTADAQSSSEQVATVTHIDGDWFAGADGWQPLGPGAPIFISDTIRSGSGGDSARTIAFVLPDGQRVQEQCPGSSRCSIHADSLVTQEPVRVAGLLKRVIDVVFSGDILAASPSRWLDGEPRSSGVFQQARALEAVVLLGENSVDLTPALSQTQRRVYVRFAPIEESRGPPQTSTKPALEVVDGRATLTSDDLGEGLHQLRVSSMPLGPPESASLILVRASPEQFGDSRAAFEEVQRLTATWQEATEEEIRAFHRTALTLLAEPGSAVPAASAQ